MNLLWKSNFLDKNENVFFFISPFSNYFFFEILVTISSTIGIENNKINNVNPTTKSSIMQNKVVIRFNH